MQHFYDFSGVQIFRNADAVHVVKFLQWVWCRVKTNKHISCISEAKFVINGAIKSVTLLAHAAFASVKVIVHLVRSRTQLSLTNCAMLYYNTI